VSLLEVHFASAFMDSTSSTSQLPPPSTSSPAVLGSQKPKRSKSIPKIQQNPDDIDKLRRQSTMRLWKVWESLSERYARPLEEDDIIDFRDNRLVQDRGILRKLTTDFGELSSEPENGDDTEWEKDKDDLPGSEDPDELDSLNPVADIANEMAKRHGLMKRQTRSPSIDDDLQEFLAAEERRKQLYGDVDADLNEETYSGETVTKPRPRKDSIHPELEESRPSKGNQMLSLDERPPPLKDVDSDDELAAWSRDEASAIYHVSPASGDEEDEGDDDDDDVPDDRSILSSVSISSTESCPSLPASSPPPMFSDDSAPPRLPLGRSEKPPMLGKTTQKPTTPPHSLSSIISSSATPNSTPANHLRISRSVNPSPTKRSSPPMKAITALKPVIYQKASPDPDSPPIKIIKNPIRPPVFAASAPASNLIKGKMKACVAPVDRPPGSRSTPRAESPTKGKANLVGRDLSISTSSGSSSESEDDIGVGPSKAGSLFKCNTGSSEARKTSRVVPSWLDEPPNGYSSPGLLVASSPVKSTKPSARNRSVALSGVTYNDHVHSDDFLFSQKGSDAHFAKKKRRRSSTVSPRQREDYDLTSARNSPRRMSNLISLEFRGRSLMFL
jgi:hypothetical protein